jgi:hypothetical protein
MRNVTHDHTQPATCESVFNLAEALTFEIARLAMSSKGSPETEGKVMDRLSRAVWPCTKLYQGLEDKIKYAFEFERGVQALLEQGAVGELEVTTPAKLTDLGLLSAQTTNNSWPTHARAA